MCFPCFLVPNCPQHLNPAKNVNPVVCQRMEPARAGRLALLLQTFLSAPLARPAPRFLHSRSSPESRLRDKSIPHECKGDPALAEVSSGRCTGKPVLGSRAGRTASQPPAGQGQERPRLAMHEASEIPARPAPTWGLRDLGREAVATDLLLCHLFVVT